MNLLLLGGLFLLGLIADLVGRATVLPRVSVLLISGILIGPAVFDLLPAEVADQWFSTLTQIALGLVGFLMGRMLTPSALRDRGKQVLLVSVSKALVSALAVFLCCRLVGAPLAICAVLAGVSTATAPTATFDVVHEAGSDRPFTIFLLDVVAIDDVWGLILFSMLLAFAVPGDGSFNGALIAGVSEVIGSLGLGLLLGLPMAWICRHISFTEREGEPIMAEALGFIFVGVGVSSYLALSPILTSIVMGSVLASINPQNEKSFEAIEGVQWPFLLLFFLLAGASLQTNYLQGVGLLLLVYLGARALGILLGVQVGGRVSGLPERETNLLGFCLFPQAGVALGMALIAAQRLPEYAQIILAVVLTSTVLLELTSPVVTRYILRLERKLDR